MPGAAIPRVLARFPMYIVAIAWIYVTLLMSLAERSFVAGVATFVLYGLMPLALFLWLVGTPERRRRKRRQAAAVAQLAAGRPADDDAGSSPRR